MHIKRSQFLASFLTLVSFTGRDFPVFFCFFFNFCAMSGNIGMGTDEGAVDTHVSILSSFYLISLTCILPQTEGLFRPVSFTS